MESDFDQLDLTGHYRMELCSEVLIDMKGKEKKELFFLKSDFQLQQRGRAVSATFFPTSVRLPELSGFTPQLDDAILQKEVPNISGVGQLSKRGTSIRLKSEMLVAQVGLKLPNPHTDAIPTHANHPWVKNASSKEPGVELRVKSVFKVFAGMVARFSVDVEWKNQTFTGDCELEYDYEIYRDNVPVMSAAKLAAKHKKNRRILSKNNWVKAWKIESQQVR